MDNKHHVPAQKEQKTSPASRILSEPTPERVAPRAPLSASVVSRARTDPRLLSHTEVQRLQRTIGNHAVAQLFKGTAQRSTSQPTPQKKATTGLPEVLKVGVERLSGRSMDNVHVHYGSDKPAQWEALAYAQGTEIHVAPGQEGYLPHEVWHVVQQAQGRVEPTMEMKKMPINDDEGLEREADVMGERIMRLGREGLLRETGRISGSDGDGSSPKSLPPQQASAGSTASTHRSGVPPIQRGIKKPGGKGGLYQKTIPTNAGGNEYSAAVRKELQNMVDTDEKVGKGKGKGQDYTLVQAIAEAKRRVKISGRFETGRKGTRIKGSKEMEKYLQGEGWPMNTISDKLGRLAPIFDAVFQQVEITETDFPKKPATTSDDGAYQSFITTLTGLVPSLAHTGSAFNDIADAMMKGASTGGTGSGPAAAMKGSMFEQWSLSNVLTKANKRVTFAQQGGMKKERTSDGYDATTQTLWDMKHYFNSDVPDDQAEDYNEILKKGYTSTKGTGGHVVKNVNYLFPTIEGAKKNEWLYKIYGFGIYYIAKTALVKYK